MYDLEVNVRRCMLETAKRYEYETPTFLGGVIIRLVTEGPDVVLRDMKFTKLEAALCELACSAASMGLVVRFRDDRNPDGVKIDLIACDRSVVYSDYTKRNDYDRIRMLADSLHWRRAPSDALSGMSPAVMRRVLVPWSERRFMEAL